MLTEFTLRSAMQAASEEQLEEWIQTYLNSGDGVNEGLSDGLKLQPRWWVGPVEIKISQLTRACGPEPEMEYPVDPASWEENTSRMAESFSSLLAIPPLIVECRKGVLSVRDGNHRLEAIRKKGWQTCWVLIWFNSDIDYLKYAA